MNGSHTPESGPPKSAVPLIAFVALALLAQFAAVYPGTEPYPSIAMPGFAGISRISDDPALIRVAYLRLESNGRTELLSRDQLFESAPPGQRNRMIQRFERMSGTDQEWAFFDDIADRFGLEPALDSAELVRRDGYGNEEVVVRIERQP